ncbi:hypothetical protein CRG98_018883 [Punica granatum]|uniref:Uncharacterized protein n=1 Tax=Punica granatum TaxID=22663 RepID=A0A2I0JWT0_PUNGR|nr:hypothetical protein CRG98_018883 [Punica granatum]
MASPKAAKKKKQQQKHVVDFKETHDITGQEAQGFGWIKGPVGPLGREVAVGIPWCNRPLESLPPRFRTFLVVLTFYTTSGTTRKRVGEVALRVARLGWKLRVEGPERWQPRQLGENGVGTLAPTTARCKIGLVELIKDGSRRLWVVSNMPSPKQTRNSERKFGKNPKNPVKMEWVERWLCTVDRLSDHDHLSTGKSEGYEGPFERDGTIRQGRGVKWHT